MDKADPSRRQKRRLAYPLLTCLIWALICPADIAAITLSQAEAARIGKKVWQNECNGTIAGLTSWNVGENFASLGIGHFIWYPEGERGPFDESFPKLVDFITIHKVKVPEWLQHIDQLRCPWKSRAEFVAAQETAKMRELRQFLADTVDLQSQFLVDRLERSLPKILEETTPSHRSRVRENFERLAGTAQGCYALVDYVNFKGEGTLHSERYHDQGWGLLQVLEEMRDSAASPKEFSRCAAIILTRRVHNSPPARNEGRWLPGWLRRVNSYSRG